MSSSLIPPSQHHTYTLFIALPALARLGSRGHQAREHPPCLWSGEDSKVSLKSLFFPLFFSLHAAGSVFSLFILSLSFAQRSHMQQIYSRTLIFSLSLPLFYSPLFSSPFIFFYLPFETVFLLASLVFLCPSPLARGTTTFAVPRLLVSGPAHR